MNGWKDPVSRKHTITRRPASKMVIHFLSQSDRNSTNQESRLTDRRVGDSFVTWSTLAHQPSVHAQRASNSDRDIVYITVNYGMSQWHCHYHSDWKLVQCVCTMGKKVRRGNVLSHMLNFYLSTSNPEPPLSSTGSRFHLQAAVISLIEIVLHPVPSPALSNVLLLVIR